MQLATQNLRVKTLLVEKAMQCYTVTSTSKTEEIKSGTTDLNTKYGYENSVFRSFLQTAGPNKKFFIQSNPESKAIIELQRYLEEECIPLNEDRIKWWKENRQYYPLLAEIAEERLRVTATSVPCEQLFSKAGMILCYRRSRLSTKKAKMLIFLNSNKYYFRK